MIRSKLVHFAAAACAVAMAAHGAEPSGRAVEYYNSILRHYFVTAYPQEMAIVETGGAGPGWSRTGGTFGVYLGAGDAPGIVPVCRFYGTPGSGPNSHFYTADAGECAYVKTTPGWTYEGIAFHIHVPAGGSCPDGTAPVYRTYNNGAARNDSNHRFTVDATVYAKAAAAGHALEGVAMCAPLASADRDADAARLLRQATFGPREADLARVTHMGAAAWVDEQLATAGHRLYRLALDARQPRRTVLRGRPHPAGAPGQLLRPRQLHALPAAAGVLPPRRHAARPAARAGRVRAVADLRRLRASTTAATTRCATTSRSSATVRSATSTT